MALFGQNPQGTGSPVVYNDNSIPFGSRVESFTGPGGVALGQFILENIVLTYPGRVIERPDELGGVNGWVAVRGQPTGTAVLQIPTYSGGTLGQPGVYAEGWSAGAAINEPANNSTINPGTIPLGSYFTDTFLGSNSEKWVITNVSLPQEINSYWKCNCSLHQAIFS